MADTRPEPNLQFRFVLRRTKALLRAAKDDVQRAKTFTATEMVLMTMRSYYLYAK